MTEITELAARIEARKRAEAEVERCRRDAAEFVDLIGDRAAPFWVRLAELAAVKVAAIAKTGAATAIGPQRAAPASARQIETQTKQARKSVSIPLQGSWVEEALELIEEIEELAEQVPERGQEFAESIYQRASDIGETVEERGDATPAQIIALENMRDGLSRWIR